jgi:hypothetical protein
MHDLSAEGMRWGLAIPQLLRKLNEPQCALSNVSNENYLERPPVDILSAGRPGHSSSFK